MRVVKPERLRKGDLVGIVAPSGPVLDTGKVERGVRYLERLGYRVAVGRHTCRVHGYLAGGDEERAEDLHAMFADGRVRAVMALRGGYGAGRLLRLLDWRLLARNPKILVGFSDLTALQLALWRKCHLVTFHGPMLVSDLAGSPDRATEESLWRMLTSGRRPGLLRLPPSSRPTPLHGGRTAGRLIGGNLSLLVSLLGTPFMPRLGDAILFFEEVGEEPYRIDRMLNHLATAGVLARARGCLAGRFTDCSPRDRTRPSLSLEDVLAETASRLGVPFLSGLPFGHIRTKITLPIGITARMDAGRGKLELLEAAVS
ncbi:MAG: LD-carboxypeptidase [Bacteroidota bacterium]